MENAIYKLKANVHLNHNKVLHEIGEEFEVESKEEKEFLVNKGYATFVEEICNVEDVVDEEEAAERKTETKAKAKGKSKKEVE